jgi:acetamidase/formamidase
MNNAKMVLMKKGYSEDQAITILSTAADFGITQVAHGYILSFIFIHFHIHMLICTALSLSLLPFPPMYVYVCRWSTATGALM